MPMIRTPIPAPFNTEDGELYADAVLREINNYNPDVAPYLSITCPECDEIAVKNPSDHCLIGNIPIIGCEGYWIIDPNLIGIPRPNWG